jgi:uncharacterized protein (DUF305 family)
VETPKHAAKHEMGTAHYKHLLLMAVLSFVSLYVLMYAMVNELSNVYASINQFYMAGLMTAPMVVIELSLMRSMFPSKKLNAVIVSASVIAGVAFWALIREQAAVTDRQFLRSMIPHHGGAILMCKQAPLQDPAVKELCATIISSQQSEIDLMKTKLSAAD